MSTLLALLGDPTSDRRPTRAQVCAALQVQIGECRARLREPVMHANPGMAAACREQLRAARRLLAAIEPDQGRLL